MCRECENLCRRASHINDPPLHPASWLADYNPLRQPRVSLRSLHASDQREGAAKQRLSPRLGQRKLLGLGLWPAKGWSCRRWGSGLYTRIAYVPGGEHSRAPGLERPSCSVCGGSYDPLGLGAVCDDLIEPIWYSQYCGLLRCCLLGHA